MIQTHGTIPKLVPLNISRWKKHFPKIYVFLKNPKVFPVCKFCFMSVGIGVRLANIFAVPTQNTSGAYQETPKLDRVANRLVGYYVSACCAIYGILWSQVGPVFAEQNTPLHFLHNWHNPAQFPFCASWCQQAAVATEVKRSQVGGHSSQWLPPCYLLTSVITAACWHRLAQNENCAGLC